MSALAPFSGALTAGLGLVTGAFAVSRAVGSAPPPLPLTIALVCTSVLLIVVGIGVMKRSRAAWSFAMSLVGVGSLALLLAVPAFLRMGIHPAAATGAVLLAGVDLAFLIMSVGEPRSKGG